LLQWVISKLVLTPILKSPIVIHSTGIHISVIRLFLALNVANKDFKLPVVTIPVKMVKANCNLQSDLFYTND
jgi:hypothetical protein